MTEPLNRALAAKETLAEQLDDLLVKINRVHASNTTYLLKADSESAHKLLEIIPKVRALESDSSSKSAAAARIAEAEIRIKELEDLKVMFTIEFQQMKAFDEEEMDEEDIDEVIDHRIDSLKSELTEARAILEKEMKGEE